jgi:hypothetical protein
MFCHLSPLTKLRFAGGQVGLRSNSGEGAALVESEEPLTGQASLRFARRPLPNGER